MKLLSILSLLLTVFIVLSALLLPASAESVPPEDAEPEFTVSTSELSDIKLSSHCKTKEHVVSILITCTPFVLAGAIAATVIYRKRLKRKRTPH